METGSNQDLEDLIKERTRKLEKMNRELEAFSYSVSHDLRTPLRAIVGFSRILEEEYADDLDDEGKRLLQVVIDNANMMSTLIDDILAFSRLGRAEIAKNEVNTKQLFEEIFQRLVNSYPEYEEGVQVAINDLPVVTADASMMKRVAENLLSNALKYSRHRDPSIIKVDSYSEAHRDVIYVEDNGVGFDMDYKNKLFGVFQRLHSDQEFEGTGIGLALVQRVINRHNGQVWAESEEGEGAAFYFSLPKQNHKEIERDK